MSRELHWPQQESADPEPATQITETTTVPTSLQEESRINQLQRQVDALKIENDTLLVELHKMQASPGLSPNYRLCYPEGASGEGNNDGIIYTDDSDLSSQHEIENLMRYKDEKICRLEELVDRQTQELSHLQNSLESAKRHLEAKIESIGIFENEKVNLERKLQMLTSAKEQQTCVRCEENANRMEIESGKLQSMNEDLTRAVTYVTRLHEEEAKNHKQQLIEMENKYGQDLAILKMLLERKEIEKAGLSRVVSSLKQKLRVLEKQAAEEFESTN